MSRHLDVMDQLRMADPLLRHDLDDSQGRLAGARRIADARRRTPVDSASRARRTVGRRRWLVLAGAATGLAVLGTAVLSLPAPDTAPSLAVTSVALGKDGTLTCEPSGGFSEQISPSQSPVRLLPTWLPDGWQVGSVWAVKEISSTCYLNPSLTVADTDRNGRVTRSAMVYGPIPEPIEISSEITDSKAVTVAGQPGQMISRSSPKGTDELLWVWSDTAGGNWLMRSYGYSPDAGQELAAALRPEGTTMGLDENAAPTGTTLVQQRTGEPYPGRTPTYHWTVTLGRDPIQGRDAEVTLEATGTPAGTFGLDGVFPDGMYVTGSGDQVQVRQYAYGATNLYLPEPGVVIGFGPNQVTGGEPTLGSMTPEQWERVITHLEQVPADDPRLAELALDE
jgi:hypothetical protein